MTTTSLKVTDELVSDAVAGKTPPMLFEQCADLCGMGNSGLGDLATNPKHLEDFGSDEVARRITEMKVNPESRRTWDQVKAELGR